MKNFFLLLVVGAAIYGGLRFFGVIGSTSEAIRPGTDAASGEPASDSSEGPAPIVTAPANSQPLSDSILVAAKNLAEGRPLGDSRGEIDAIAKDTGVEESALARHLLAVDSEDAKARWIAASRLAVEGRFDGVTRDAFAKRAVEFARAGVIASTMRKHKVVKGDSLERICKVAAKDHGVAVTPGMLRWVNGISGDRIKPNQEILVPEGAFRITVSKGRFQLDAWLGDGLIRRYRVAIGKDGKTPQATFRVEGKLEKPPWDDPSTGKRLHFGEPGYALGTRWIAFDAVNGHTGLGIHGTDDPASIGSAASLGCIRLANEDVEDLYALVPVGAVVVIGA